MSSPSHALPAPPFCSSQQPPHSLLSAAAAAGRAAARQAAKTYLEKHYESFAACTMDELVKHGLRALAATLSEGELTKLNVSVAIVGKGAPFVVLEDDDVEPYVLVRAAPPPSPLPFNAPEPWPLRSIHGDAAAVGLYCCAACRCSRPKRTLDQRPWQTTLQLAVATQATQAAVAPPLLAGVLAAKTLVVAHLLLRAAHRVRGVRPLLPWKRQKAECLLSSGGKGSLKCDTMGALFVIYCDSAAPLVDSVGTLRHKHS